MLTEVTDQIEHCEVTLAEPPDAIDPLESVVVAAGGHRLELWPLDLLEDGVGAAAGGATTLLVDRQDRIGD